MKSYHSHDSSADDSSLTETERIAAEWTLRQAHGLNTQEEQELARWLAGDKDRARLFTEMEQTSHLLDGLKFQMAGVTPVRSARRAIKSPWRRIVAVAAAAAVIGGGVWEFARVHRSSLSGYALSESTPLGETKRLELPDGSVALLNTNTAVEVSYEKDERRVRLLSGEAFFTVAKNPQRPFIVQAGRIAVRAVGTAFDVRLSSDALNVLVTEGKVRVSGSSAPSTSASTGSANTDPLLEFGHMARVVFDADRAPKPNGMVVSALEERAIKSALAWQEGRLEFSDTPLSEVVAEFNRYNQHKIVIADAELGARRFGGGFASHEIEPLLELLEQSFGVVAEHRASETIIRQVK